VCWNSVECKRNKWQACRRNFFVETGVIYNPHRVLCDTIRETGIIEQNGWRSEPCKDLRLKLIWASYCHETIFFYPADVRRFVDAFELGHDRSLPVRYSSKPNHPNHPTLSVSLLTVWPYHTASVSSTAFHRVSPDSTPDYVMSNLCWTKGHWSRFPPSNTAVTSNRLTLRSIVFLRRLLRLLVTAICS
jgi:hypothetical protein